ncbi:COX15/CtaA family protein [Wenzhouxiangella sp. XN24]|uniref:COX15/CtaA family protein n=1 Tax=Wenzhouxiangella sp. XN24 TaxID=2713569 RepID=UPI0013E9A104|nr:COX15/CtaA family protein [Wenzhouxiangella sp. XN24]NGX17476.1 heme A synthase [Wenzhouxiangella sp. XN24]
MKTFRNIARVSLVLCLVVVVLGAWVRLTDAGLGCPDWPGCYGKMVVPAGEHVDMTNPDFAARPFDTGKAWREMIHRYAAGILGLLVLVLAVMAWRRRHEPGQPVKAPLFLAGLILFQVILGMWTVTLLLKPTVVTLHLLGGMATLGMLVWLSLPSRAAEPDGGATFRRLSALALVVVIAQITLGGWVSTNYAALSCPDFPKCQGQWWPEMDFAHGFTLWHGLGVDYEGGILHNSARVAIHVTHRVGAVVALLAIGLAALWARRRAPSAAGRLAGSLVGVALLAQILLGIVMVKTSLPLAIAVAHNGLAAVLLASILNMNKVAWRAN